MSESREINIHVPVLARVEGEGALDLRIRQGEIHELKLRIFEPPRLFEKFLEGRSYTEVPDMVARICGICPVAYQLTAVQALEACFGTEVTPWITDMRRVMYCGEWIQSHALHIHLLAAPDFLGYDSVIAMSQDHAEAVRRGLRLQHLGNELIRLFGGRSVHPVGVRVGGFHRAPAHEQVQVLLAQLQAGLVDASELVAWTATLPLPEDDQTFTCVVAHRAQQYPLSGGRLVSSAGLDIDSNAFEQYFREFQVPHSTALHCTLQGAPYLVGPLARLNLCGHELPEATAAVLHDAGLSLPSRNMFHSVIARAVEIHYAISEAIRLLANYSQPDISFVAVAPRTGTGTACTEAPRGLLWHRYDCDEHGQVRRAVIVPPTSQNQARIEQDLRESLTTFGLDRSDAELRLHAEKVIRNYDPCISCATHFLRLAVDR